MTFMLIVIFSSIIMVIIGGFIHLYFYAGVSLKQTIISMGIIIVIVLVILFIKRTNFF
jgi:hypothetical protein